jgi:hypothetical protein
MWKRVAERPQLSRTEQAARRQMRLSWWRRAELHRPRHPDPNRRCRAMPCLEPARAVHRYARTQGRMFRKAFPPPRRNRLPPTAFRHARGSLEVCQAQPKLHSGFGGLLCALRLRRTAHRKAKIGPISHLTQQIRAPIYRAHAARRVFILRAALLLWHDENSRRGTLFDIVIRGRGTWVAARLPARSTTDRANESSS